MFVTFSVFLISWEGERMACYVWRSEDDLGISFHYVGSEV